MLIYGREIRDKLKAEISQFAASTPMRMAIIVVGEDGPSQAYVKGIVRFAEETGIKIDVLNLPAEVNESEVLRIITELNNDSEIDGIMLQKPLPNQIDDNKLVNAIAYHKDVEGIHNYNLGKLISKQAGIQPSTPKAVIRMLKEHNIPIEGKNVTIVGRSTILGSPLAVMMTAENGTVTVCHTRTKDLKKEIFNADILVAAMGRLNFITADMVREDTVIIDAGINFDQNGKMFGDVDETAREKAAIASAVPGGVGVITVAELFDNLKQICVSKQKNKIAFPQ
ncbi:MAG TPA: bifunctional 5,10-methylenetetrahydrofolate dehydrogenase/5,10-methenyltetrahydrofolate cyclohydrolase [Syntrophomonadaceae bacterium]|nr:bifunctional 5,10-methylenetetrahydrofolate dehydrogenase/5,10-methenyltetrahydrofolate cyclohydrolase [Syntrophomonadaceae bacterium]HNX28568.1 bifunctional 5,10-methylenetetrahydrofolate dehydrogenase/5,10-methenyltetrahydrofolate cyclohydrolase [Syntrophomonadaceae bacterium]HPR92642.1 bifunctional 5,10-methylenetetrahydrofolate dehydrogenase/5,10-methenyltetrahydrofolate cyclohydrolase [Syntrophomonadaceae bacterium]